MAFLGKARTSLARIIAPTSVTETETKRPLTRADQLPIYVDGVPYSHSTEMSLSETIAKVKRSPVTLGCINAYVRRIQQLTFRIQRWNPESRRYEFINEDHPVEERWDQPAKWCSQKQMLSATCFSMMGTGNWLATFINSDRKDKGLLRALELSPLDPDFVDPIPDVLDVISGYSLRQGDPRSSTVHLLCSLDGGRFLSATPGRGKFIPLDRMIHAKFSTNKNPWWGLSPIEAAALAIDTGTVAQAWNRSMVGNRLEEGGVLETEQALTRDEIDEAKRRIAAQIGGSNAGSPIILTRGLTWKSTNRAPREMDYVGTDKRTDWKICAALGVPPVILGQMDDATLNNAEFQKRDFWVDSVLPFMELILESVNHSWVWPGWGREVRLWYDTSNVLALQEKRQEKVEAFGLLHDRGYPANALNAWLELGLPDLPPEIGDKSFIKSGLTEFVDQTRVEYAEGEIVDDEPPMLEEGDDPEKTAKAFLSASEERDAYWFAFEGQRERWYGKVEKRVAKLIGDDLEAAAAVADRGLSAMENAIEQRAGLWRKELEGTWDQIAQEFGKRTHDGLVKAAHGGQEFKAWDWGRSAREYIRERVRDRVSAIVETTKGWVGRRVREANMPDDGGDAGQNIRDQAPEYSKTRGATIGQTEVLGASGYGSNLGANRSGAVKNKIWLTSRDDRVRDSHRTLEGQKRPLDQPYSNGLMFPGDPTGPPSETIKCRCVELYEV